MAFFDKCTPRFSVGGGTLLFLVVLLMMFVASCSSSSDDPVITGPALAASVTELQFDETFTNQTQTLKLTITNHGMLPAQDITLAIEPANSDTFTIAPGIVGFCGSTLNGGASCDVEIRFAPTQPIEYNEKLKIKYAGSEALTVNLKGKGITPAPVMSIDNETLDFGNVQKGSTLTKSVKVTNIGSLQMTGLIVGDLAAPFSKTSTCASSLEVNASCDITVVFAPTTSGAQSATLNITSTDGGNKSVSLSGTGTLQPVATLTVDKSTLAFDNVSVNESKMLSFKVKNEGGVQATGISFDNLTSTAFSKTGGNCGATLDSANECTVEITFNPTSSGAKTATLDITSANAPKVSVSLTGKGVAYLTLTEVYMGEGFALAISDDGTLYSWGRNNSGQLGTSNQQGSLDPVKVALPAGVKPAPGKIYVGINYSIVKGDNGKYYAWGYNVGGLLGVNSNSALVSTPTEVVMPQGVASFTKIDASQNSFVCAFGDDGNMYTWGYNALGQLGVGNYSQQNKPTKVSHPSGVTFTSFVLSENRVMALGNNGKLYAWGSNSEGALGLGTVSTQNVPTEVTFSDTVSNYYLSYNFGIAKLSNGKYYGWGKNDKGQLALSNIDDSKKTPVEITSLSSAFTPIHVGKDYVIALSNDGTASVWGNNDNGQLGLGQGTPYRSAPIELTLGQGVTLTDLYVDSFFLFNIGKGSDGKYYSWGDNSDGQLGLGSSAADIVYTPQAITFPEGVTSFLQFKRSFKNVIAKGNDDKFYVWGNNTDGHLGTGNTTKVTSPIKLMVLKPE